jgi:hypothetical protein
MHEGAMQSTTSCSAVAGSVATCKLQVRVQENVYFHFECKRPHSTFASRT